MESKIELQHDPLAELIYDREWMCPICFKNTRLQVGADAHCVFCGIDGSGKDHIIVFGWQLTKASFNQINASRIDK